MNSKLSKLVRNSDELIEELVADTLFPLLSLTDSGDLLLLTPFHELEATLKVLTIFLSLKALSMLQLRDDAIAGPTEISNLSGIPIGTVKREVRCLEAEKLLISERGKYWIPSYSLSKVADLISKKELNNE